MKILHLCAYYETSKVHSNLFNELSSDLEQCIFVAVKEKNSNSEESHNVVKSHCLRHWMKISLMLKSLCIVFSIFRHLGLKELRSFDYIHCHTLFADGLPGFILSKIVGVPFFFAVRNSDYNSYLKYFPHLRLLAKIITRNSERVIFISQSYLDKFQKRYPKIIDLAKEKKVIANGLDDFWIDNSHEHSKGSNSRFTVLSIGYFDRNKNFGRANEAIFELQNLGYDISHELVGGDSNLFERVYNKKPLGKTIFHGVVKDKCQLKNIFENADLLLVPSHRETFGLVYLEALSQGLPVICSDGQGISGMISSKRVSYCQSRNVDSIFDAVSYHYKNREYVNDICLSEFSWRAVAKVYLSECYL